MFEWVNDCSTNTGCALSKQHNTALVHDLVFGSPLLTFESCFLPSISLMKKRSLESLE